jgi:hypothetical protein
MLRSRLSALWLAVSFTATTLACLAPAEQPLLNHFFAASRLRDRTALGDFSTVAFEPATHGIINTFSITKVTPEKRTPLTAESVVKASQPMIDLSLADARNRVDVPKYDGDLVSKDVTIDAPVKLPGGETVPKTLVVTMQRVELRGDRPFAGRWIVTSVSVKDAPGSGATPRS